MWDDPKKLESTNMLITTDPTTSQNDKNWFSKYPPFKFNLSIVVVVRKGEEEEEEEKEKEEVKKEDTGRGRQVTGSQSQVRKVNWF
ncbi:hypothetical protein PoB_006405600 [Plakobranchus ocellatus]|uniref:Uncharacterized protein n=1 Tax=Plakobranchus ocellatus TaxID=259542 RepID=A0AAV4D0F7_9GAST|nr:hypothetical protein PoB_006405600 [Plakobranchus ocellatus]